MAKSEYSQLMSAMESGINDISFQLASFLVRAIQHPEYADNAGKATLGLLKGLMKIVPEMISVQENIGGRENTIRLVIQKIRDEGNEQLAREIEEILDYKAAPPEDEEESYLIVGEEELTDRERKKKVFGTEYDEMKKLSLGIVEKKTDAKKKSKKKKKRGNTPCDKTSGNKFHGKDDGRFIELDKEGDATEDYSYSGYFQDGCKARAKGKKGTRQRQALSNKVHKDCGRGDKENQGRGTYKCSTGEKAKVQEMQQLKEHFRKFLR